MSIIMLVYLPYCCVSVYMYMFFNCIVCMYSGHEAAYYQINQSINQSINTTQTKLVVDKNANKEHQPRCRR